MERKNSCRFWVLACLVALHFTQVARAIADSEDEITWKLSSRRETPPTLDYRLSPTEPVKDSGLETLISQIFGPQTAPTTTQQPPAKSLDSQKPAQIFDYQPNIPEKKIDVAIYDEKTGLVRCPERTSTGFYVHPRECGFFVNCDRGRPFLTACPPNTLFDSYTKMCDYADMVSCDGRKRPSHSKTKRVASNPLDNYSTDVPALNIEQSNGKPKCPKDFTGYLPYPKVCTKLLHCDKGQTFIKSCGPGTVFNPATNNCDWPYNVKECSGATGPSKDSESLPNDNVLTSESYKEITKHMETNGQSSKIIAKDSHSLNDEAYKEDVKSTGIQFAQGSAGIKKNGNGEQGLSYDGESTLRSHEIAWSSGSHGTQVTGSGGKHGQSSQGQGNYAASQDSSSSNIGNNHESSGNKEYQIPVGSHETQVAGSKGKDDQSSQGQANYVARQDSSSSNSGKNHESSGSGVYVKADHSSIGIGVLKGFDSNGKPGSFSINYGNANRGKDLSSSINTGYRGISGSAGHDISHESSVANGKGVGELDLGLDLPDNNKHIEHGSDQWQSPSGSHDTQITGFGGTDGDSSQGEGHFTQAAGSSSLNNAGDHEAPGSGGYQTLQGSLTPHDKENSELGFESNNPGGNQYGNGQWRQWGTARGSRPTGNGGIDDQSAVGEEHGGQGSSSSNSAENHESSGSGRYKISDVSHGCGRSSGSHGSQVTGSEEKDGQSSQGQENYVASQDSSSSNSGKNHESSGSRGYVKADHKSIGIGVLKGFDSKGQPGSFSINYGHANRGKDLSSSINIGPNGILENGRYKIPVGSHESQVAGSKGKDDQSSQGQANYVARQNSSSSNSGKNHESSGSGVYVKADHKSIGIGVLEGFDSKGQPGSFSINYGHANRGKDLSSSSNTGYRGISGSAGHDISHESSVANGKGVGELDLGLDLPDNNKHIEHGSDQWQSPSGSYDTQITGFGGTDGDSSQGEGHFTQAAGSSSLNNAGDHQTSGSGGYQTSQGSLTPHDKENSELGFDSNNPGGNQYGNGQWYQWGTAWGSRPTGNGGIAGQSAGQGYDGQGSSASNNPGNYQTSGSGGYQQSQGSWMSNGKDNGETGFGSSNPGGNQHGDGQWDQSRTDSSFRPTGNGGVDGKFAVGHGYDNSGSSSSNNPGNDQISGGEDNQQSKWPWMFNGKDTSAIGFGSIGHGYNNPGSSSSNNPGNYQTSGSGGYQQSQGSWMSNGKDNGETGFGSSNPGGNQHGDGQWDQSRTDSSFRPTGNGGVDGQSAGQGYDGQGSSASNNPGNYQTSGSGGYQQSQGSWMSNGKDNGETGFGSSNPGGNQHGDGQWDQSRTDSSFRPTGNGGVDGKFAVGHGYDNSGSSSSNNPGNDQISGGEDNQQSQRPWMFNGKDTSAIGFGSIGHGYDSPGSSSSNNPGNDQISGGEDNQQSQGSWMSNGKDNSGIGSGSNNLAGNQYGTTKPGENDGLGHELNNQATNQHGGLQQNWAFRWHSHTAGNKDSGVEQIENGGVRLSPSSRIGSGVTDRGLKYTIEWNMEHKWVTWTYTCPKRIEGKPLNFAQKFILPDKGYVEIIPTDCDVIIIQKGPSGDKIWERRATQFYMVTNSGEYDDGSISEKSWESDENESAEEDVPFNVRNMLNTWATGTSSPTSNGEGTHGQSDTHNPHFHGHKHHHHHRHDNRKDGGWRQVGTRPDAKYPTGDRRHYGRTNTNLSNSGNDSWSSSNENVQGRWIPRSDHNATGPIDQSSRDFRPSSWRGQGSHQNGYQGPRPLPDAPPKEKWNQGVTDNPRDKKLDDWLSRTNIIQSADKRREQDSKMDDWSSKTNIFNAQQGNKRTGVKTSSRNPYNNGPTGINVNVNGIKGHYITRELEVNQGHSNTRNYGRVTTPRVPTSFNVSRNGSYDHPTSGRWIPTRPNYGNGYVPIRANSTFNGWKPMGYKPINETFLSRPSTVLTPPKYENNPNKPIYKGKLRPVGTTESPSKIFDSLTESPADRGPRTSSGIELPTVTIEEDYHDEIRDKISVKANETMNFADVVEPDVDKYEVEVLEKEKWKPRLTFENKTTNDKVESVIMGINRKNKEPELIDVRFAPWHGEEPSFPVYYIAGVQPLGHTPKNKKSTPATGQILRLRGGTSPRDGYLEVQGAHPGWGIVCDSKNGWSLNEAHIVCRQLGYTRGAEMAWQGRNEWDDNEVPWIASTQVDCKGNETHFQTCKFVHGEQCLIKRDAVGIRCMSNRLAHCRDDEIAHEGQCYHLANPESAVYHNEAGDYCSARKAKLIDITTQAENNFLSEWLLQSYPTVNSIMTSGIGFNTLNRTLWLWEDSARAKFQFSKWWPGWINEKKTPPRPGSRPVCVVMKKQFPCHDKPEANCTTDYFFWDVEDCAASMRGHSYICERSYDDISCVYGKGQQYAGNANVSASGKKCLPWNDKTVAHSLRVNVLNSEVRNQLMSHNYCRNPNPTKSSRPWCYTGAYGEHDYCDIPPCGEIGMKRSPAGGNCKPKHFECMPGECIPSPWVCDGEEDCTNGMDERACSSHLGFFKKIKNRRLEGYDVEKWLNTPAKSCALRCKEADFTCRSFSHASDGNVCLLSDTNIGGSGALKHDAKFDYYEMKDRSVNCDGMFVCENQKCVNQTKVCDGKNNCGDRSDEKMCTVENLGYEIRLGGSNATNEGRVEVKVLGLWGQVCDDGFGMNDANVVCKELGFEFGALQVRSGGYYGNMNPPERFMVDQLKCRGNETSLRECDFDGWGVHNCAPEEAVGVICKSAVNTCQSGQWKCDDSPTCIPPAFICDEVEDCPDKSDESPSHCEAPFELRLANGSSPLEGRVEVRHHGVWGTVCDDDFSHAAAKVICKSLGYGGLAVAKKDGFYGPGDGPIWLDEVFCHGNETQLYKCEHNTWGTNNCDHGEDAGVKCTEGPIDDSESELDIQPIPEININDLLPSDCGKRLEDFGNSEDEIFQKVVRGSIAPKGSYPWQASLRIRGHSRSSHWCGAVVLSPLHVLTAAHCLEGYNKGTYFVRAGDYHTEIDEGTEVEANIEDYYIHEDFRKGQRMNNDIALVLLKGPGIPLGEHVMPICLPPANVEYSPDLNCTISGFGSIETGTSDASLHLRYGWVPLIDQSVCRASYVYGEGNISDGMVCAGYLEKGVDACEGDSGGPLACRRNGAFTLYGVTSWGHRCGETNKPGVYVRVAYYRDWIDRKIRESIYGR